MRVRRPLIRTRALLFVSLLLVVSARSSGSASTPEPEDFYRSLLERGYAEYANGKYADAVTLLRIASFGSLDDIPSFQRANVYIALSSSRIRDQIGVINAVAKVTESEGVSPAFASLALGADRAAFEKLARPLGFVVGVRSSTQNLPQATSTSSRLPPAPPAEVNNIAPVSPSATTPVTAPVPRPPVTLPKTPEPKSTASKKTSKPVTVAPRETARVAIKRGNYALQIAIACEQGTVDRYRKTFSELLSEPIRIKDRPCFRVLIGRYSTSKQASEARDDVGRLAGEHDRPIVVTIPQ